MSNCRNGPINIGRQGLRRFLHRFGFRRNISGAVGIAIAVLVAGCALLAPVISPHSPTGQDISVRLRPPGFRTVTGELHPLGTDHLGRDVLSRLIYGTRISVLVGFLTVVVRGVLGTTLGMLAGFRGGRTDSLIITLMDIQLAIPFLVLAVVIMSVLGPGLRNVIIVLSITGWVTYARVVRAEVNSVKQREFVESARSLPASGPRIVFKHLLPNVSASIIVISTLEVAQMIIAEGALSFLGMGVPPPTPSWGSMVADGREFVSLAWWASFFPGMAIFITVLGINLTGDWLRDVLDPTLKHT